MRLAAKLRLRDQNAGILSYNIKFHKLRSICHKMQKEKCSSSFTSVAHILFNQKYETNGFSFISFIVSIDQNVICFVPFYIMYVFFMTLHIKFAYSTYRIALRYLTLNNALRMAKTNRKFKHIFLTSFHLINIFFVGIFGFCMYLTKQEYGTWKTSEPVNRPSMGLYLKRYTFVASVNHGKDIHEPLNEIQPMDFDFKPKKKQNRDENHPSVTGWKSFISACCCFFFSTASNDLQYFHITQRRKIYKTKKSFFFFHFFPIPNSQTKLQSIQYTYCR